MRVCVCVCVCVCVYRVTQKNGNFWKTQQKFKKAKKKKYWQKLNHYNLPFKRQYSKLSIFENYVL